MAQEEIEVILTRQLSSYLAHPVFLVDPEGNLIFYNEPAERILGRRFDETGELPADAWASEFRPTDDEGALIPPERLPLLKALHRRRPSGSTFWITGLDGERRRILVNAFPLIGQGDRFLGAVAMFWEVPAS
jgi:PAS domain-containing protein